MISSTTRDEIRDLVWRSETLQATDTQVDRLSALVGEDLDARCYYIEYVRLLADLQFDERQAPLVTRPASTTESEPVTRLQAVWHTINSAWNVSLALAALVVISTLLSLALIEVRFGGGVVAENETRPTWVARITTTRACRWEVRQADGQWVAQETPPGEATRLGFDLETNQTIKLLAGTAEITFDNGARVTIEGQTELIVRDEDQLDLLVGKLAAMVPTRAIGFRVNAPNLRAVDLGTEFALQVQPTAWTDLHVFRGKVKADALTGSGKTFWSRELLGQQAIRVEHSSQTPVMPQVTEAKPEQFVRSMVPGKRPTLVALYRFDGDSQDSAGQGRHALSASNVTYVPGRDGQAVKFSGNVESYVDLPIDAGKRNLPQLTWGGWVRVDSLQPGGNEIVSTDNGGYDRTLTIDPRGAAEPRHRFALLAGSRAVVPCVEVEPVIGEWMFVACVFDESRLQATLYVEDRTADNGHGKLVATTAQGAVYGDSKNYLRLGMHASGAAEPLDGAIDDFFVVGKTLTETEVENIRRGDSDIVESLFPSSTD